MVGIEAPSLDADAGGVPARASASARWCLFRGNLGNEARYATLTAALARRDGPTALIGIDQEGGAVVRATFLPHPPAAMALGAAGDAVLAEEVGAAVARGIASARLQLEFRAGARRQQQPGKPGDRRAQLLRRPGTRSRGSRGAWMRGALREGVACCVKHFPGHGDTHVDSHLDLPVVDKSRRQLDALELLPFRALLTARRPAIMTAHIVYPQLDPDIRRRCRASSSATCCATTGGYDGVVITDSLVMKAIHERYGHDRAAVLALQAGADMVMALGSQRRAGCGHAAIEARIASGALDRGRARACTRAARCAGRRASRRGR